MTTGSPAETCDEAIVIAGADGPPARSSAEDASGAAAPPVAPALAPWLCTATGSLSGPFSSPPEPATSTTATTRAAATGAATASAGQRRRRLRGGRSAAAIRSSARPRAKSGARRLSSSARNSGRASWRSAVSSGPHGPSSSTSASMPGSTWFSSRHLIAGLSQLDDRAVEHGRRVGRGDVEDLADLGVAQPPVEAQRDQLAVVAVELAQRAQDHVAPRAGLGQL